MTTLTITVGLPGCGKTTWAHHEERKTGTAFKRRTVVYERDMIREARFGSRTNFANEGEVTDIQEAQVQRALYEGLNVIVSDTNLSPKAQKRWRNLASRWGAEFVVKDFTQVPYEEVLRRNLLRPAVLWVPEAVIHEKAVKYGILKPEPKFPQIVFDPSLPHVVIADLDGTTALMGGRSPYEHGKYHLDTPNDIVRKVLWMFAFAHGYGKVIYASGRKEGARQQTLDWLCEHIFPPFPAADAELFLRADDDNRKDDLVKYEILRDQIAPKYFPALVLDDRNQVVDMWRSQGIPTFQVNDGNF